MFTRARDAEAELNLPPGFRFHPTDEELVVHYLCRKAASQHLPVPIIAELDLYKYDPWQLPEKALFGQREWYFFTPRDRKYPNGSRPNRAAGSGYWKATGADKHVVPKGCERAAGIKKALVFYAGKAPRGVKTNWIMHEYRLAGNGGAAKGNKTGSLRLDDWVLCRLYNKKNNWQLDCPQAPDQQQHQQMQVQIQMQMQQHSQTSASIDNSSSFEEEDGSHGIGTPESDVDNNESYAARHPTTDAQYQHQLRPIKEDNSDWFMDLNLDDLNHLTFAAGGGGGGFGGVAAPGVGGCAAGNPSIDATAYQQYPYQYQDPYLNSTGGLLSPMFTKTHHHVLPPF